MPELIRKHSIRLLVVDSLAGLIRMEFDNRQLRDMTARTKWLFGFAQELKLMSELFRVAVVVVNQVQGSGFGSDSGDAGRVPALGLAWSNCVNTRLGLYRDTASMRATAHCNYGSAFVSSHQVSTSTCIVTDDLRDAFYDDDHHCEARNENNLKTPYCEVTQRPIDCSSGSNAGGDRGASLGDSSPQTAVTSRSRRMIVVELSARRPASSCLYAITGEGIFGL